MLSPLHLLLVLVLLGRLHLGRGRYCRRLHGRLNTVHPPLRLTQDLAIRQRCVHEQFHGHGTEHEETGQPGWQDLSENSPHYPFHLHPCRQGRRIIGDFTDGMGIVQPFGRIGRQHHVPIVVVAVQESGQDVDVLEGRIAPLASRGRYGVAGIAQQQDLAFVGSSSSSSRRVMQQIAPNGQVGRCGSFQELCCLLLRHEFAQGRRAQLRKIGLNVSRRLHFNKGIRTLLKDNGTRQTSIHNGRRHDFDPTIIAGATIERPTMQLVVIEPNGPVLTVALQKDGPVVVRNVADGALEVALIDEVLSNLGPATVCSYKIVEGDGGGGLSW